MRHFVLSKRFKQYQEEADRQGKLSVSREKFIEALGVAILTPAEFVALGLPEPIDFEAFRFRKVSEFVAERVEIGGTEWTPASVLFEAFAKRNPGLSKNGFGRCLSQLGLKSRVHNRQGGNVRTYNVKLRG